MAAFLGEKASVLLEAEPYRSWPVERTLVDESDPLDVNHVFVDCGLSLKCDGHDERIHTLFLEAESHAGTVLSEVPFHYRRDAVLARFGAPSKTRGSLSDPILGEYGRADVFRRPEYTIHVEYNVDSDSVRMITLMRNDVVP